jgi:hypothetical protein
MKYSSLFLNYPMLLALTILSVLNSCEAKSKNPTSDINLVACTPGDEQIKSLLAISPGTKVDFIRWNLILTDTKASKQSFILNIVFGESQPNTLGFKGGGEKKSIEGQYTTSQNQGGVDAEIYHLKSSALPNEILMRKLNDNIFHLLTSQKHLMVGNGGWSYTLNRKQPLNNGAAESPALITMSYLPDDTAKQIIFEGRTPCLDFAKENNLTVAPDCFKLKWKLILNRDPESLKPTVYILHRTNSRESDITGKWAIIKGLSSNPNAVIYQLDPDKPDQSISLLLGDENVAFFLHKDNRLFVGNEDFSYTLNKRQKQ